MTDEETTRLARGLADGRLKEIHGYLPHLLGAELLDQDADVDPELVDLLDLAVQHVLDLKTEAGGKAAAIQDLERLLDARIVTEAVAETFIRGPRWSSVDELRAHCGLGPMAEVGP